jgi:hypothetical protein
MHRSGRLAGVDARVKPTAVRFNFVDWVHGIDSTGAQAFSDGLDTDEDQRHAAPE